MKPANIYCSKFYLIHQNSELVQFGSCDGEMFKCIRCDKFHLGVYCRMRDYSSHIIVEH